MDTNPSGSFLSRLTLATKFAAVLTAILLFFFAIAAVAVNVEAARTRDVLKAELAAVLSQPETEAGAHQRVVDKRLIEVFDGTALKVTLLMFAVTIGVVMVVYWQFVFMIRRRLSMLANRFKDIAEGEGDLRQRVDVRSQDGIDRLGSHFNGFLERIHATLRQVVADAGGLAVATARVSEIARRSNEGVTKQQSDLD